MGQFSLIVGIVTVIGAGIAFVPLLGWLNWFNLPLAFIGVIVGVIAMVRPVPDGEGLRGRAIAGLVLNGIAIVVGIPRLIIGFGVF